MIYAMETQQDLKIMDYKSSRILITGSFNQSRSINQSETFCSILPCAILSKLIKWKTNLMHHEDGSTCWLLRGHLSPIKAPLAEQRAGQCPHRHRNVSDAQPVSAPGSLLPPPSHHRSGWVGEMLQREESWLHILHLGPSTSISPRPSWPMPQQLRLHSRRVIEPKVLLSERFPSFSDLLQLLDLQN